MIREKQIGPMHSYFNRLGLVGRKNVLDIWEIFQKIETIMTIDKTWLMERETALHARFQHDRECPRMTHRRRRGWTSHFHCRGQENSSLSLPPTREDCDSALRRHDVRHHWVLHRLSDSCLDDEGGARTTNEYEGRKESNISLWSFLVLECWIEPHGAAFY